MLARGQFEMTVEQGVAFLEQGQDGFVLGGQGHFGSPFCLFMMPRL
jgi:hypothetical protein